MSDIFIVGLLLGIQIPVKRVRTLVDKLIFVQ